MKVHRIAAAALATAVASGCAIAPALVAPEVPPSLRVPSGQALFLEAMASGAQIYECASRPGQPGHFQWVLRDVQAQLVDRAGRTVGKHYYPGPTWESADGDRLVTEVKARAPAPDPTAVPWLLLGRKSATGEGMFSQTTSIQRVRTAGGIAPPEGCGPASVGQIARVPYTATFYFYRSAA